MNNDDIPNKGSYCLICYVKNDCKIKIGAKGLMSFPEGYYVYVGSALSNLTKRIERHLSSEKKKHWHMDYFSLNKNVNIEQVIYTFSTQKIECELSNHINKKTANYIESFGCSDCNCMSHLYYFDSFDEAENVIIESFKKIELKPIKWF